MATFTFDNEPGKVWFISDTHFGHKLVARQHRGYGDPPDTDTMNEDMLDAINRTVMPNDFLIHLGDVSFMNRNRTTEILDKIKCKNLFLVKGNHDYPKKLDFDKFVRVCDYAKLKYKGKRIMLMHFPIEVWDNRHHGSYHFHGHSHGGSRCTYRRIDAGIDNPAFNMDLRPHSPEELIDIADTYGIHPEFEDHHKITA